MLCDEASLLHGHAKILQLEIGVEPFREEKRVLKEFVTHMWRSSVLVKYLHSQGQLGLRGWGRGKDSGEVHSGGVN